MATEDDNGGAGCGLLIGLIAFLYFAFIFLKWLWGITVATAIWFWLAPGRLLAWIISWPLFSGHLLLWLIAIAAFGVFAWQILKLIWPRYFLRASTLASNKLNGCHFWWGEEVIQFNFIEFCDHNTRSATVQLIRCFPQKQGQLDHGIGFEPVCVENISVYPDKIHISSRIRTLRQPTRTYLESLNRHGLELLATDSIEVKAWQALNDSEQELNKLNELWHKAYNMWSDAQTVLQLSSNNELISPSQKRCHTISQKLVADISKIETRCKMLRCFGYKLYEFMKIPRSLRSFDLLDNIEYNLFSQQGLSDELFEEIKFNEQAYAELLDY